MKITFVLFLLLCLGRATPAQQIKSVVAWERNSDGPDSSQVLEMRYSRKGDLLHEGQPAYYVSVDYKYDEQGRVIEKEAMYGESIANGTSTYKYEGNKACETFSGGYDYTQCDSLDERGNILRSDFNSVHYDYGSENRTTEATGRILTENQYTYNSKGQITSCTSRETHHNIDIDPVSGAKIAAHEEKRSQIIYQYDGDSLVFFCMLDLSVGGDTTRKCVILRNEQGLRKKETKHEFDSEFQALYVSESIEYKYDADGMVKEKIRYMYTPDPGYFGFLSNPYIRGTEQYENGKLVQTEEIHTQTGASASSIRYYYTYWD